MNFLKSILTPAIRKIKSYERSHPLFLNFYLPDSVSNPNTIAEKITQLVFFVNSFYKNLSWKELINSEIQNESCSFVSLENISSSTMKAIMDILQERGIYFCVFMDFSELEKSYEDFFSTKNKIELGLKYVYSEGASVNETVEDLKNYKNKFFEKFGADPDYVLFDKSIPKQLINFIWCEQFFKAYIIPKKFNVKWDAIPNHIYTRHDLFYPYKREISITTRKVSISPFVMEKCKPFGHYNKNTDGTNYTLF